METDVGASQNIVRTMCITVLAVGFATPMGTGVILSTPTRDGIRTGSITTTTTTAVDRLGNTPHALGPAGCGAQVPPVMWRVDWLSARLARRPMRLGMRAGYGVRQDGHDVPRADVIRRFKRGWTNFLDVYRPLADHWTLYDISESKLKFLERGP